MTEKSKCCGAKVVVRGKTTMYYVCLSCGQPCDVIFVSRKYWNRNPKTQIVPNKKQKIKDELSKKEIDEIRKQQDF